MTVRICVLGPLRGEVDGVPVDLGGRRQRAVLARLAVTGGEVVSVDTLVDDLWPGDAPQKAIAALQVQVSLLRRVLEPRRAPRSPAAVLVSAAPGYALALGADGLDSRRFVGLLDRASAAAPGEAMAMLTEALGLWSGAPFAEFGDEPWAAPEAARLAELRVVAAERLGEARLATGAAAAAVPDLERVVHDHPLREGAVQLLAAALYRSGRQADALAVLARARRRLADELGVDPGPQLQATEREILAHGGLRPVPTATAPVAPPPAPGREAVLGRDAELERLRAVAKAAVAARGVRMVLVAGEPGAGKSVLVDGLRAELAAAGWAAALGRCPEVDGAPPGWAWREITRAFPSDDERLRPLHGAGGPGAAEETFWVGQALVELLGAAAAARPLLLVLDDLHRAEGETLQLLRWVVAGLAAAPVLVVATVRPAEIETDVEAALAALAGPIADRIELGGLSTAAVADLLARHGAGDADAATAALVGERTGGNPLFVRELARLIATDGAAAAAEAVPAGVRDVLRRRLHRLPAAAGTVLRHAAVLGGDVDVDVLVVLPGRDTEDATLDAVELGIVSGLLTDPAGTGCGSPTRWSATPSTPTCRGCVAAGCTPPPSTRWPLPRPPIRPRWPTTRWPPAPPCRRPGRSRTSSRRPGRRSGPARRARRRGCGALPSTWRCPRVSSWPPRPSCAARTSPPWDTPAPSAPPWTPATSPSSEPSAPICCRSR